MAIVAERGGGSRSSQGRSPGGLLGTLRACCDNRPCGRCWSKASRRSSSPTCWRRPDEEKLADFLAECVPADPANAKLLAKYLKKIIGEGDPPDEFHPTKTKVEKGDIETWSASSASSSKLPWMATARANPRSWKSSRRLSWQRT